MTRRPVSLHTDDLSAFSRALARQLGPAAPSHLSLMNMLARAAGYQNLQHLRAAQAAARRFQSRSEPLPPDARAIERALQQFDELGRLRQWPSKRTVQTLALWALWARLPAETTLQEPDLNRLLREMHSFDDPATIRRTMISCKLLTRKPDGRDYRRLETQPPAEAQALISALKQRASCAKR